jgi:hypothetical protein
MGEDGKIEKASTYFLDGAFTATGNLGSTWTPEPGSTNPPPTQPPADPVEVYHWFDTGEDISILTKDKKLNDKLIESQMVYRGGMFFGFIKLDASSPIDGEPLIVIPRGNHIPFVNRGLANFQKIYGSGHYSNKDDKDGQFVRVKWILDDANGLGLQFEAQNVPNSLQFSRVKKGFPTNWETYGLFLSWSIGVP